VAADPAARQLGIVGEDIEGYGCPGLDPIACGLATMELNRGDGSLGTVLGVHSGLAMKSIAMLGSEEQKQRWLPAMARLEKLGAFALTEPDHGSDSVALETTARRDGDRVRDRRRQALDRQRQPRRRHRRLGPRRGRPVHGFLVEKGTPGYHAEVIEGKGSLRAIWQAQIASTVSAYPSRTGCRARTRSRTPGASSRAPAVTCAWAALGHAVAAYDTALTYAMRRQQFGKPLVSFQIVQDRLVRMLAEVTEHAALLPADRAPRQRGQLTDTIAGLAKLNNTRKARQICAEARDLLGGNGILLENHVIRHMADIEAIHTYEGTETMQTLIVGRDITGVGAFSRPPPPTAPATPARRRSARPRHARSPVRKRGSSAGPARPDACCPRRVRRRA
jgi:glutaryl-CoA dehydrogenase